MLLSLVIVAIPLLVSISLQLTGHHSLLGPIHAWLTQTAMQDSWWPMQQAFRYLNLHPDGDVYGQLLNNDHIKFQYPPTSLLVHHLLAMLGIPTAPALFAKLSWAAIVITCIAVAATAFQVGNLKNLPRKQRLMYLLLSGILGLLFYPLMRAYSLGQAQVFINMLFALACYAWIVRRKAAVGALLACICLLKPQFSLFFVWGLLRKEHHMVVSGAVTAAIAIAVSVFLFGLHNHLSYLGALSQLSRSGECFWANQSINGILNRLTVSDCDHTWQANAYPAYHALVYFGTLASSLMLICMALFKAKSDRGNTNILDFQIAALSFTMASPIAWDHHYGILPAIYVCVFFVILQRTQQTARSVSLSILAVSYVLTSNYVQVPELLSSPVRLVAELYLFSGVVMLLGLMYFLQFSHKVQASYGEQKLRRDPAHGMVSMM